MHELERELSALAGEIAYPETPDLASTVAGRLPPRRTSPWPRRLALIAAAVAVAVLAGLAVPQTRAEILRFFGLGAVEVEFVDRLPPVSPDAPLALGERIELADAPFPVLTSDLLGPPDEAYAEGDVVTLLYGSQDRVRLLVTEIGHGSSPPEAVKKVAGSSTRAEFVPLEDDMWALWISGEPHVVGLPGAPARLAANTLVWTHGDVTLRLEGATSLEQAVRIARSLGVGNRVATRGVSPSPSTSGGSTDMRLRRTLLLALAILLAAPTAALAKGASEATITGPGLGDGITLAGEGQQGGEELMQIADSAGFFMTVFGSYPSSLADTRPKGDLGPRYTIEYTMPGPSNELDVIVQDVYPYAKPSPVTHMAAGQPYFTTERTVGGWFVASTLLKDQLVSAGLPETPPSGGADDRWMPWAPVGGAALVLGLGLVGILALLRSRRGSEPAPA